MTGRSVPRLRRALLATSGIAALAALTLILAGGFSLRIGDVLLRAKTPSVAMVLAVASAFAAVLAGGPQVCRRDLDTAWRALPRIAPGVALAAALASAGVGLAWGTWAASGADAYGYVSQAWLWVRGALSAPVPLADSATWPAPESTLAPLGWRPAPEPGAIVPTYAPGLPLLMALAAMIGGGGSAMFWVVPLTGAVAVWWTWRLGTVLADRVSAAAAALLMACGPAFLFQIVQPMSDVPVTAWWTGALLFTLMRRPALAGACTAMAILTRPNLAPLAGWLALLFWFDIGAAGPVGRDRPTRRAAVVTMAAAAAPGILLWLATNRRWYGAWLASGYGAFSDLFNLANVGTNARHYTSWLLHAHTPFVLLALTSPFVLHRMTRHAKAATTGAVPSSDEPAGSGPSPAMMRVRAAALVWALLVVAAYLPYASFSEWTYLRFLLPALPVLLVLSCGVATAVLARFPAAAAVVVLAAGVVSLAAYEVGAARRGQVFDLQRLEHRYVETGRFVARELPASAVLFAVQQSGSLRLYAGRPTLRWDNLDPDALDRTLAELRARGLTPYFVLEAWEEPQFRDHLSRSSVFGRLDWPPACELSLALKVRIYDPADRAVFVAGGRVSTKRFGPDEPRRP